MAIPDSKLFDILSTLELAEQENEKGGNRYMVKQAANNALQLVHQLGAGNPICNEITARANKLLNS